MKKFKMRKNYLIFPKIQLTMIFIPIVMYTISFLISAIILYLYYENSFANIEASGINSSHPLYQYMELQKNKIFSIVGISIFIGFIFTTIILTWITHRIVGPVYRIHKSMQTLLKDEVMNPIKLRKSDYFTETAQLLEEIRKRGLK